MTVKMSTDFVLMNYCWIWAGLPIEDQSIKITVVTLLLILNSCPAETETLEKGVNDVVLMFLLLTLNIFHAFFRVSIVDFQQVNVHGHVDVVCKKMLKISLNSQESTCAEIFFYLKVTPAQVFCNIFENISFAEHFGWLLET